MIEVERELQELVQAELLREEQRRNLLINRLIRSVCWWFRDGENDPQNQMQQEGVKDRHKFLAMVARCGVTVVGIVLLTVALSNALAYRRNATANEPTKPPPVAATAISMATIASLGLYAAFFSQLRMWPFIPQPHTISHSPNTEMHGTESAHRNGQTHQSNSQSGGGVNGILSAAEAAAKKSQYRQYWNSQGSEPLGVLDVNCCSLDGLGYNAEMEFFDTINIDDSVGKGSYSSSVSISNSYSQNFNTITNGAGATQNHNNSNNAISNNANTSNSDSSAAIFPSLGFSFDLNLSGRRTFASGKLTRRASGNSNNNGNNNNANGGNGSEYSSVEEFSPSFNPINSSPPTFV